MSKKTDEEILKEMLKKNPKLLESLLKVEPKEKKNKIQKTKTSGNEAVIESGPLAGKKIEFFDDSTKCIKEKEWDKKNPVPVSERTRKESKKINVVCGECGKNEQISESLFDPENTHVCSKCFSRS